MEYLLLSVISYLLGAIPFAFLIGKFYGKDIRREGSGNVGATNVTRVIGKGPGRLCFALDFAKGAAPVIVAARFFPATGGVGMLLAGAAAVAGHMFPVYLKFKGGKGISTAGGVAAAMMPQAFLFAGIIWVVVFKLSGYVSLASIVAAISLPLAATIFGLFGGNAPVAVVVFFYCIAVFAVWKHRENIKRLRNGTESRFERKKKES